MQWQRGKSLPVFIFLDEHYIYVLALIFFFFQLGSLCMTSWKGAAPFLADLIFFFNQPEMQTPMLVKCSMN